MIPDHDLASHVSAIVPGLTRPTIVVAPKSMSRLIVGLSAAPTEPVVLVVPVSDEPNGWTGLEWIANSLPDDVVAAEWQVVDRWSDERLLLGLVVLTTADDTESATGAEHFSALADELLTTLQHHHRAEILTSRIDVETIRLSLERLGVDRRLTSRVLCWLAGDGGDPQAAEPTVAALDATAGIRVDALRESVDRLAVVAASQAPADEEGDGTDFEPPVANPLAEVSRPRPTRLLRLLARCLGEPPVFG